ncbi:YciI family protein [Chitinophaga japonensis]|uniref:YCII-related domain-containing protein n=1 Tax=Chitinophaga japonensis TaxID=104662 RepID=A0A562STB5_CHIJA|nr:YciI family protein [Chitinophaga japonensis]TWI84274.1 hypothetical protein LX66_4638 [Chitinophaga japonensis]
MQDFMLLFRSNYPESQMPDGEMAALEKKWEHWINDLAARQRLSHPGHRLLAKGKTRKPGDVVTDGPYTESKECVCGFIIIKAASLEEAFELTKDCPIQEMGGNVEVREVMIRG